MSQGFEEERPQRGREGGTLETTHPILNNKLTQSPLKTLFDTNYWNVSRFEIGRPLGSG